jgi:hypothetical protein
MSYQIIAPVVMPINASSYKDAVKQYVKLQRDASINQLIVADQLTNNKMLANIKYYQIDNRRKFRADLVPTTLSELDGGMIFAGPTPIISGPDGRLSSPPMMRSRMAFDPRPVPIVGGPLVSPGFGGPGLVGPLIGPGFGGPLVGPGFGGPLVGPGLVGPGFGGPLVGPGLVGPSFGGPLVGPGLVGPGFGGPIGIPIGGPYMPVGSSGVTATIGTVLPTGTKVIKGSNILPTTVFPQGTVLPQGTVIDVQSVLPNGIFLPVGTNILAGTTWTPGAIMPPVTALLNGGASVPGVTGPTGAQITFAAGTIIPAGAVFPSGTFISSQLVLPDNGTPNDRVNIPKGFNLLAGNTVLSGSIFPNGTAMQGSTIDNNTFFDNGTIFSLGTTIRKGCVFPLGTIIPTTARFPWGTYINIPLGTADIVIGSSGLTPAQLMYIRPGVGYNLNNITLKAGCIFTQGSVILPGTNFPATSELSPNTEIMGPTSGSTGVHIMPAPVIFDRYPSNRSMSPRYGRSRSPSPGRRGSYQR